MEQWIRKALAIALLCLGLEAGVSAQSGMMTIDTDLQVDPVDVHNEMLREDRVRGKGHRGTVQVKESAISSPRQGILILNQGGSQSVPVTQQQPTTYVEANQLNNSRVDQLRRARQGAEVSTERKIVEKLEESRLQDERRRGQRLFGDVGARLNSMSGSPSGAGVYSVQPQIATVQVVTDDTFSASSKKRSSESEEEDIKSEIVEAVRAEMVEVRREEEKQQSRFQRYYMSGFVGMPEYLDVENVKSNIAAGGSFGVEVMNSPGFELECFFAYSNHEIEDYYWGGNFPYFKKMDQYNTTLFIKYEFFQRKYFLRPFVGGGASYVYRQFFDHNDYHRTTTTRRRRRYSRSLNDSIEESAASHSVDVGFIVGVTLDVNENFSLSAGYNYMTNVASRTDSKLLSNHLWSSRDLNDGEEPIEHLDYSIITVNGRLYF